MTDHLLTSDAPVNAGHTTFAAKGAPTGASTPGVPAGASDPHLALESGDAAPVTMQGVQAGAAPLVAGLDLSLVSTGLALISPSGFRTHRIHVEGNGIVRLRRIAYEVKQHLSGACLVVVEGPSYGSPGRGQHERAGLWWLIQDRLWRHGIACAVVPPANLKKYAVGIGGGPRASKDAVLLAAARRWAEFTGQNDEADALWLAAMGLDHLTGTSNVPSSHRVALTGCAWPTVPAAS